MSEQSASYAADTIVPLAQDHTGMRVDAFGILGRIRDGRYFKELNFGCGEMLRHLEEMGQRYYAGDIAVVDEFLQLYCLDEGREKAVARAKAREDAAAPAPGEPVKRQQSTQQPRALTEALRQYRHNDGSGLVFAYELETTQRVVAGLVEALEFYANGDHLMFSDEDAWDTVTGEPPNLLCDDAGTAMVENGTIAAVALAAHRKGGEA